MKIEVEDTNGQVRQIEVSENPTGNLMEILTEERLDVPAICGGMISCGTCHVQIIKGFEQLDPAEEDEAFLVESLENYTEHSRLSCQIPLTDELEGAKIKVAV